MICTSKLPLFYSARGRKEAQGHNSIQVSLSEYGCEIIFRRRRNVLLAVSLPISIKHNYYQQLTTHAPNLVQMPHLQRSQVLYQDN